MNPIGSQRWALADNYIPAWSHGPTPDLESHDAVSFLNAGNLDAHVNILAFFADREPAGPYRLEVPARRTSHVRLNNLRDPEPLPRGKGFAILIESDLPLVVQQTRLDSRQAENALMTTIAYAG